VTDFPYLISPLEAIQRRAIKDRTEVSWYLDDFNLDAAGLAVQYKDVALVFVNSDSGEGECSECYMATFLLLTFGVFFVLGYIVVDGNEGDRKNLTAWHGGRSWSSSGDNHG
jgi:hypothetical protein